MKAKDISGQAPGGKRIKLAEALPLKTPFLIEFFPIYACNFKCRYCIYSLRPEERRFVTLKNIMDFNLYKKCIDEIGLFPGKLKMLRFSGIGEPLLHKDIVEMVRYAKSKNVAENIEIITNASLLNPKLSEALISAGLSRLIVSLQGLTGKKYKEVSGVDIDFEKFIDNLRYFFSHRQNTHVYIKIVDYALENKDDEARFYDIFGEICDTIAIEHIVPIQSSVDYKNILKKEIKFTQFGLSPLEINICPQPFYTLRINTDGMVIPCYSYEFPGFVGDCNFESVYEIWNGKQFQNFRKKMLEGRKNVCKVCANCKIIKYRLFPEDILDNDVERLKNIYKI